MLVNGNEGAFLFSEKDWLLAGGWAMFGPVDRDHQALDRFGNKMRLTPATRDAFFVAQWTYGSLSAGGRRVWSKFTMRLGPLPVPQARCSRGGVALGLFPLS